MKTVLLFLFTIALIIKIKDRITFERNKENYSEEYHKLYHKNNTLFILIFLVLVLDKLKLVFDFDLF